MGMKMSGIVNWNGNGKCCLKMGGHWNKKLIPVDLWLTGQQGENFPVLQMPGASFIKNYILGDTAEKKFYSTKL